MPLTLRSRLHVPTRAGAIALRTRDRARAAGMVGSTRVLRVRVVLVGLLGLFGLAGPAPAQVQAPARSYQGWVMEVPSGDTVAVRDEGKRMHRVHLRGVAAPQGLQAYGGRAQAALRDLVFRQVVTVDVTSTQGTLEQGAVRLQERDVNLVLITQGHAWVDAPRLAELAPDLRKSYQDAEAAARLARTGLWREKDPVPPWDKPAPKPAQQPARHH